MRPAIRLLSRLSITFILALLLAACGDDDKGTGPAKDDGKNNKTRISAVRWLLVGLTADPAINRGNGVMVADLYAEAGACVKDDVEEYKADGTWSVDNGALKCKDSDPQTMTGTWMLFPQDQFYMNLTIGTGNPLGYRILEITDTTFKVSAPFRAGVDNHLTTQTFSFKAVK